MSEGLLAEGQSEQSLLDLSRSGSALAGTALYASSRRQQPDGSEYFVVPGMIEPVDLLGRNLKPENEGRTDRLVKEAES